MLIGSAKTKSDAADRRIAIVPTFLPALIAPHCASCAVCARHLIEIHNEM